MEPSPEKYLREWYKELSFDLKRIEHKEKKGIIRCVNCGKPRDEHLNTDMRCSVNFLSTQYHPNGGYGDTIEANIAAIEKIFEQNKWHLFD